MEHVVIGLNDEVTARAGVTWAIERARTKTLHLLLVAELDTAGSNPGKAKQRLTKASLQIKALVPSAAVEFLLADRPLLPELLERSETADLIVVGSHADPGIREIRTPSFPVSLGARAKCPVVIVPYDWEVRSGPIVVGVEAEGASDAAVAAAAREAIESGRELRIVHTWEPWMTLATRSEQLAHDGIIAQVTQRVRIEFPAARIVTVLAEAVAHEGIIANSRDANLIVLGSHGIGRESGVVLGAIHQEVMIRGSIPLCVVPLPRA